jgi:hypothetical protein
MPPSCELLAADCTVRGSPWLDISMYSSLRRWAYEVCCATLLCRRVYELAKPDKVAVLFLLLQSSSKGDQQRQRLLFLPAVRRLDSWRWNPSVQAQNVRLDKYTRG